MNARRARTPVVLVTWIATLTAASAGCVSASGIRPTTRAAGSTLAVSHASVPVLEPSFLIQDVPELPGPRSSARRIAPPLAAESDVDHVARLMARRLHCGDTYANDVGGRNAECVAVRE
jgi:hypothetical protein